MKRPVNSQIGGSRANERVSSPGRPWALGSPTHIHFPTAINSLTWLCHQPRGSSSNCLVLTPESSMNEEVPLPLVAWKGHEFSFALGMFFFFKFCSWLSGTILGCFLQILLPLAACKCLWTLGMWLSSFLSTSFSFYLCIWYFYIFNPLLKGSSFYLGRF